MHKDIRFMRKGMCPYCGKQIYYHYNEREWKYGNPIKTCGNCKKEYIDKRFHEIAVEGIEPNALSLKANGKKALIMLLFFALCFLIHYAEVTFSNRYHPIVAFMMIIEVVCLIALAADSIMIKIGAKEKKLEKLREESVQRIYDRSYAQKLADLGYSVPEKYL